MKVELDIPDELLPVVKQYAEAWGVPEQRMLESLTVFQLVTLRGSQADAAPYKVYLASSGMLVTLQRAFG